MRTPLWGLNAIRIFFCAVFVPKICGKNHIHTSHAVFPRVGYSSLSNYEYHRLFEIQEGSQLIDLIIVIRILDLVEIGNNERNGVCLE